MLSTPRSWDAGSGPLELCLWVSSLLCLESRPRLVRVQRCESREKGSFAKLFVPRATGTPARGTR